MRRRQAGDGQLKHKHNLGGYTWQLMVLYEGAGCSTGKTHQDANKRLQRNHRARGKQAENKFGHDLCVHAAAWIVQVRSKSSASHSKPKQA